MHSTPSSPESPTSAQTLGAVQLLWAALGTAACESLLGFLLADLLPELDSVFSEA